MTASTARARQPASSRVDGTPIERDPGHDGQAAGPRPGSGLGLAEGIVTGAVLVVCVVARLPRWLLGVTGVDGWVTAMIVVVAGLNGVRASARAPFSFARYRRHQRHRGLTMVACWAGQEVKVLAVTIVVGSALTVPLYAMLRATAWWWLLAGVMFAVVTVAGQVATPLVLRTRAGSLAPAGPALAERVGAVATLAGVDIGGGVMVAGRGAGPASNAYVVGLGPTRKVVLEAGIAAWPPELIDQVVAHEIGHWRLGHTARRLPLTLAVQLASLAAAASILSWPSLLGLAGVARAGDPRSYPLVLCLTVVLAFPARSLLAWRDRAHERAADRFALDLLASPERFAVMLQRAADEGGAPRQLAWWRRLTASHPPIDERTVACLHFAPLA